MKNTELSVWIGLVIIVAVGTFWGTQDRVNWLLDAGWVVVGLPLIVVSRHWFSLTPLLYRLLGIQR